MPEIPAIFAGFPYYDADDIHPVTRITAAPVGDPRQHYFILQAHIGDEPVSWVIERDQARNLSRQIPRLLADVAAEYPELPAPMVAAEPNLAVTEPWQPQFRVGSLGLEYDRLHDMIVLTLVDADALDVMAAPESDETTDSGHYIYTTRGQALLLAQQADKIITAGRPCCPKCDEPMDDFGHFCLPAPARKLQGQHLH